MLYTTFRGYLDAVCCGNRAAIRCQCSVAGFAKLQIAAVVYEDMLVVAPYKFQMTAFSVASLETRFGDADAPPKTDVIKKMLKKTNEIACSSVLVVAKLQSIVLSLRFVVRSVMLSP
jgi:hypothetical protein